MSLQALREEIRELDREILERAAHRLDLARVIGGEKAKQCLPVQDFHIEKQVLEAARATCLELDMDASLGDDLMRPLIQRSLLLQERDRIMSRQGSGGKDVLIIGGAGAMGQWFATFLGSQGHAITILDLKQSGPGPAHGKDIVRASLAADVIIVATPPSAASSILDAIGRSGTRAVIFDICSLKAPIRQSLESLHKRGFHVCSIHPMFGPGTDLLSGQRVVVCPLGDAKSVDLVRTFFAETCATLVEMGLDEHDGAITHVLGLSHAVNIIFNDVLTHCGHDLDALQNLASTTFEAQIGVAALLADENPDLYYEIQALNHHSPSLWSAIERALTAVRRHAEARNKKGFTHMMHAARRFYETGRDRRARHDPWPVETVATPLR